MEKYCNYFKYLTEQEENALTSNYMDFVCEHNKKMHGMDSEANVKYYLGYHSENEIIDRMLGDVNNITDLLAFSEKYKRKILILKLEIRRSCIEEIYQSLDRYKYIEDVYKIREFLIINEFNQKNLPNEWIKRIASKIDSAINNDKKKARYESYSMA